MITRQTLASCVFVLAGMSWVVATPAQNQDIERWKHSTWQMSLKLEAPNLVPPAVQWTVLDKDPVPGFRDRVKTMQGSLQKRLERANDEAAREQIRSSQMTVNWDLGFKEVTGYEVNLLTSVPGVSTIISSNGPDGKKWIVTKIVQIKGKPVCWCIPAEVKTGNQIEVTLTEKTVFGLEAVYDETMRAPSQSK